jgi:biopolymer transport protein ExbB
MLKSIVHFLSSGGIFMIPLVLCSLTALTLILERAFALRRSLVIKASLAEEIEMMRLGQDFTRIDQLSEDESTSLSRLVRSCLRNLPLTKYENTENLQTKARGEISRLERGLVVLEIIVGIGPLLGLLGTISGLIGIFGNVGADSIASQGFVIAKGISEALNTTVSGLVVAIPALIAHSIFSRMVEGYAVQLEDLCMELLTKLYAQPAATNEPAAR